jgi:hypothetical protein
MCVSANLSNAASLSSSGEHLDIKNSKEYEEADRTSDCR